jgi:hypothetical protein
MNFLVNEIFFSIQGRAPIRDRAQRGAGAQRSALCDLGEGFRLRELCERERSPSEASRQAE